MLLHSFNCIEYPIVFVALNRLGAICSSSPPMLNAEALAIQIESAQVHQSFDHCGIIVYTQPYILRYCICRSCCQAKAVISHKALVGTARSAALLAGVPETMVFSIADGPEPEIHVQSIEYVSLYFSMVYLSLL